MTVRGPFHRKDFKLKKMLIEKVEKELPLLIMEQLIFYIIYIYIYRACGKESSKDPIKVFSSRIFLYKCF